MGPLLALALLATRPALQEPPPAAGDDGVVALFRASCASCHGESGDGDGWAELDRRARSFREGGFSYGNTEEAILRTITAGIPGTPMPSFATSLSEEDRRRLARHVIALGPPREEVERADTILVVHDRPLAVRGMLPPLAEGGEAVPRGLLLGTTDGLTFEYRVDDVRLRAVRAGELVERTDWGGRGGTALRPLGKVVYEVDPAHAPWTIADGEGRRPLAARLFATSCAGDAPVVEYDVVDGERVLFRVQERVSAAATSFASGFRRELRLDPPPAWLGDVEVELLPRPAEWLSVGVGCNPTPADPATPASYTGYIAFERPDGLVEYRSTFRASDGRVEEIVLVGTEWKSEHLSQLRRLSR